MSATRPGRSAAAPAVRPRPSAGGRQPAPGGRQPALRLLTADDLAERSRRRRARAVALIATAVLVGALLAVAGAQALVASQQVRLDSLQQQLAGAVTTDQGLQLEHAELTSPGRILQVAEQSLGMVVPKSVTYLSAVDPAPKRPAHHRPPASGRRPAGSARL